jgi:hypothetical protein
MSKAISLKEKKKKNKKYTRNKARPLLSLRAAVCAIPQAEPSPRLWLVRELLPLGTRALKSGRVEWRTILKVAI